MISKEYRRKWRAANKEKAREYQKKYWEKNKEQIREKNRKRHQEMVKTPEWRENRRVIYKKQREKFSDKKSASYVLRGAVRAGKIKRLPCEVCGEKRSEGHHDDYSKPLEVKWLCSQHHHDRHRELGSL